MTAPDTTGGELRDDVAVAVRARMEFDGYTWDGDNAYAEDVTYGIADAVLALPALRDLLAERDKLAAQVQAVEAEVDAWGDASREWYQEHRYDSGGTTYACGFEDGWNHAEECIRRALGTPTTGGGE